IARLNGNLVAKYGVQVCLVEAETMRYVADNSDVPVPRVHGIRTDPATRENFIIMDFVPGMRLYSLLLRLTQSEKDDIARRIMDALTKLRNSPEPGYLDSTGRHAVTHGML
ncbi:hypothetical protein K470DRAFT_218770, partial [Piedraia hortae CBS 480.64]